MSVTLLVLCVLMGFFFLKLECEMYAPTPSAHLKKGALRPHYYYFTTFSIEKRRVGEQSKVGWSEYEATTPCSQR